MTTCRRCGTVLVDAAVYCHRCGATVDMATTVLDLGGLDAAVTETDRPRRRRWLPVAVVATLAAVAGIGVVVTGGEDDDATEQFTPAPSTMTAAPYRSTRPPSYTITAQPGEVVEPPPVQPLVLGRETGMSVVLGTSGAF